MGRSKGRKYPFFIIIDDAGFKYALPEDRAPVPVGIYENILELAKEYRIRIPVCITAKYLDKENLSGVGEPLEYVDDLVCLLKENEKHLEIGYHGLTHEYEGHAGEFYKLDVREGVPERVQRHHVEASCDILNYLGIPFPRIFVPPYNAWERSVTDRIVREAGGEFIVAYRKLRFNGNRYRWNGSDHLRFLPRTSLGISGSDCNLDPESRRKIKLFPEVSLLEFTRSHILPQPIYVRARLQRAFRDMPVHSYMTHIGNFSDSSMDFWRRLFDQVGESKDLELCESHDRAVSLYCNAVSSERRC